MGIHPSKYYQHNAGDMCLLLPSWYEDIFFIEGFIDPKMPLMYFEFNRVWIQTALLFVLPHEIFA